jgi:hypothetical protein
MALRPVCETLPRMRASAVRAGERRALLRTESRTRRFPIETGIPPVPRPADPAPTGFPAARQPDALHRAPDG